MSEVTPEELNVNIRATIQASTEIPSPVDPTLKIAGAAADAKATGDKIAAALGKLKINDKSVSDNAVTLYGSDIKVSDETGAQTLTAAIEAAGNKTANDIIYDTGTLQTTKAAIDEIKEAMETDLDQDDVDEIMAAVFEEASE